MTNWTTLPNRRRRQGLERVLELHHKQKPKLPSAIIFVIPVPFFLLPPRHTTIVPLGPENDGNENRASHLLTLFLGMRESWYAAHLRTHSHLMAPQQMSTINSPGTFYTTIGARAAGAVSHVAKTNKTRKFTQNLRACIIRCVHCGVERRGRKRMLNRACPVPGRACQPGGTSKFFTLSKIVKHNAS